MGMPGLAEDMASSRRQAFRDALQVRPERIAALDDAELNELMRELLLGQAYRCGASASTVQVNSEGKAKDEGCDAWSPTPSSPDEWLGSVDTCWQFKAGSAGQPARLAGEVGKRIPRETLTAGGRFVVVAAASKNGKKGVDDRLRRLRNEAHAAGLPPGAIDVLGSESLTTWCNQHPAIAAHWASRPEGLCGLEEWLRSEEHQVPWQSTDAVRQAIEDHRQLLDFVAGQVLHLHIQGPPGVGKTRLALELCRNASWRSAVVYVRQAADLRLPELIDGATSDPGVRLMVVADEVQEQELTPLRDSVGRGNGRVRLISIGHCKTPDPRRIPAFTVGPLANQPMTGVVRGWYPAMPPEHVDFIVRFADGYVRLAHLAADAVARDPSMDVHALLDLDHIRRFLDRMLGDGNRRPLYVLAVLTSVGWTGDRTAEGEAIARHLGLDWNSVLYEVEAFHRRYGIAPRGGRCRYISPSPLGIHLAVEAWTTYPGPLKTLADVLPTEEAIDAYYRRLQAIVSNPQAREFARAELSLFLRLDDFVDSLAARRWSALSAEDPVGAAHGILCALSEPDPEERKRIAGGARREIVSTLVRLAWPSAAFHDAVKALALLAEAENETWANNASGEFIARFQVGLGGTAAPYLDRLIVLDELLATNRPVLARLIVKALAQVGNRSESRSGTDPASDQVPEPEWHPGTQQQYLACAEGACRRLSAVARKGLPGVEAELLGAAHVLAMLLRPRATRDYVVDFFEAVRETYPDSREALRREIARVLYGERKYWKQMPAGEVDALQALHSRFEDSSLPSRLRQHLGQGSWEPEDQIDLSPLAAELLTDRGALAAEWPWLTSGEAAAGWSLGEALATNDTEGQLEAVLPALEGRGPDLRVLCGYVHKRQGRAGTEWFDRWIAAQMDRDPCDMQLLFEVTCRCDATVDTSRRLAETLRQQDIEPRIVGQLCYGRWGQSLPADVFAEVLLAMAERGHEETAIAILYDRLKLKEEEALQWNDLSLRLVLSPKLIRSGQTTNFYWKEVAGRLVPQHSREIAAAVLREHADRSSGTWFVEHSEAEAVLRDCVNRDPQGVWAALKPHLSSLAESSMFSIGFPRGVVDRTPVGEVGDWVAEHPEERASIVSHLVSMDFSSDNTFASRLVGSYGDNERVARAFYSEYVSGFWWGQESEHWGRLADNLAEVAGRTTLPTLRRWARNTALSLRRMAEEDRKRQEEEDLRRN